MDAELETTEREKLIAEILTWENTPFHDCANLKGQGVDCANLVYEACHNVGLVQDYVIPEYTPQFLLHSEEEKFLEIVEVFCKRVSRPPKPGDLRMFKYGKCFSHGAFVLNYPEIIHARKSAGFVVRGNESQDIDLQYYPNGTRRPSLLYTLKQWS